MQNEATKRVTLSVGPALGTLLMVGAGVAAIAQPLTFQPYAGGIAQPTLGAVAQPATVRIVLPTPVRMAPVAKPSTAGVLNLTLDDLAPDTLDEPDNAALAAASAKAPISVAAPRIEVMKPTVSKDELAAARAKEMTSYSPARYVPSEDARAPSNALVGDEDWAAMTRPYTASQSAAASGTDRTAALQPTRPARPVTGAVPILTEPAVAEPSRLAAIDANLQHKRNTDRVSLNVSAKLNGAAAGRVSLLIRDDDNISVRLADVLAIIDPAAEPDLHARLSDVQASQGYVTFNDLRTAGVAVRFDDRDRLILATH